MNDSPLWRLVSRLFSILATFLMINTINAQTIELIGETSAGGPHSVGVIFKVNGDGTGYDTLYTFSKLNTTIGFTPMGHLIQGNNGEWYGILTNASSTSDSGVLFSFNITTRSCKKLFTFSAHKSTPSFGNIVKTPKGKLYLTTSSDSVGSIFCYDPVNSTCKQVLNFNVTDGKLPYGSLLYYNDKLYGMTAYGGANNYGELFCFNPSNNTYKKLFDFSKENGVHPWGNLILAKDGKFYGMTSGGGTNDTNMWNKGDGVLFCFNPVNNNYKKLYDLKWGEGSTPQGSLTLAANGKLYGDTWYGGAFKHGVVFTFDPSNNSYTDIYDFNIDDGSYPHGDLIMTTNNLLYGMTSRGGTHNCGVIFTIDTRNDSFKKIYDFERAKGALPFGNLSEVK